MSIHPPRAICAVPRGAWLLAKLPQALVHRFPGEHRQAVVSPRHVPGARLLRARLTSRETSAPSCTVAVRLSSPTSSTGVSRHWAPFPEG